MTTLQAALGQIQDGVAAVSGVMHAPDYPPEKPGDFPFVAVFPGTFTGTQNTPEDIRMLYNVHVELHIARTELDANVYEALPYAENIANAIFKALNANVIPHGDITGTFGAMEWGGAQTIGFSWIIQGVKIVTTLT